MSDISKAKLIIYNFPINWRMLKAIADSSAVKSSFIWLLIVPLLAKALAKINDTMQFDFFGNELLITTSLPFSWQHLFWAACWFTLANIIYHLRCPELVKTYKTFTDFEADGKGQLQINSSLKSIAWVNDRRSFWQKTFGKAEDIDPGVDRALLDAVVKYFWTYTSSTKLSAVDINRRKDGEAAKEKLTRELDEIGFSLFDDHVGIANKIGNAFYFVDFLSSRKNKIAILLATLAYGAGFYHLIRIAIANVATVISL